MSNIHTLDSIRQREENERKNRRYEAMPLPSNYSNSIIENSEWQRKRQLIQIMIGLNCMSFIGWQINPYFMWRHFLLSNDNIQNQRYYVMLTSSYSHRDLIHLGFNMYSLYQNGTNILDRISWKKFLILYIGSGLMANCSTLLWNIKIKKHQDVHSLGASGSLMGLSVVLGLIRLYRQWKLSSPYERDLNAKIKKFLMGAAGKDILFLLFLQAFSTNDHASHVGGALFGCLFWKNAIVR